MSFFYIVSLIQIHILDTSVPTPTNPLSATNASKRRRRRTNYVEPAQNANVAERYFAKSANYVLQLFSPFWDAVRGNANNDFSGRVQHRRGSSSAAAGAPTVATARRRNRNKRSSTSNNINSNNEAGTASTTFNPTLIEQKNDDEEEPILSANTTAATGTGSIQSSSEAGGGNSSDWEHRSTASSSTNADAKSGGVSTQKSKSVQQV